MRRRDFLHSTAAGIAVTALSTLPISAQERAVAKPGGKGGAEMLALEKG